MQRDLPPGRMRLAFKKAVVMKNNHKSLGLATLCGGGVDMACAVEMLRLLGKRICLLT